MSRPRKPFPFAQADAAEFARWRRVVPDSPDAKYTYFMRDRISGLIKIGMSRHPDERRARLSSDGSRKMEILLTLRDGNLERCYHQHFADLCVGGEWFEPHPDILAEIERLQPSDLTNGGLPSPVGPLSNLLEPPQARFGQKRLCEADGCVMYFLAGAGLIKIGISTGLTNRLRAIRNSSPVPLELLATMPSNNVFEGFMHMRFSHLRKHGEWFTDDGAIRAHIENLVRSGKAERPQ